MTEIWNPLKARGFDPSHTPGRGEGARRTALLLRIHWTVRLHMNAYESWVRTRAQCMPIAPYVRCFPSHSVLFRLKSISCFINLARSHYKNRKWICERMQLQWSSSWQFEWQLIMAAFHSAVPDQGIWHCESGVSLVKPVLFPAPCCPSQSATFW